MLTNVTRLLHSPDLKGRRLPPIARRTNAEGRVKKPVAFASVTAFVGLVGASAVFAGSAPSFVLMGRYASARTPWSVAIGDLNGDGKPDLVTANIEGKSASVLINRGDGRFATKHDYRIGHRAASVVTADLNGDGAPDLAVASYADTVSVLLNRGDGTFRAKREYRTGRGLRSVAVGDLNGDGTPDLATANAVAGTVSVLLGDGVGSFRTKRDSPAGRLPVSVVTGDFNGDGSLDVATANAGAGVVSVLLNRGDGNFGARHQYATGYDPRSVAVGDLNDNGTPDLVTANYYPGGGPQSGANSVSVLLDRGDGTFRAKRDYRTGRGPISVAIGDLNGDSKPDMATANPGPDAHPEGTVSVLFNGGRGTFRAKRDYRTGRGTQSVAIGDLNGDGNRDLATANSSANVVRVLLNSG